MEHLVNFILTMVAFLGLCLLEFGVAILIMKHIENNP